MKQNLQIQWQVYVLWRLINEEFFFENVQCLNLCVLEAVSRFQRRLFKQYKFFCVHCFMLFSMKHIYKFDFMRALS